MKKNPLKKVDILEFAQKQSNQNFSFDIDYGEWLNIFGDEKFLFSPSITMIAADSSSLKTWFALAYSVTIVCLEKSKIKRIYYLDFDNTMQTYKERKITPYENKAFNNADERYIDNLADDMRRLSNIEKLVYLGDKLVDKLCDELEMDDISPYEILKNVSNLQGDDIKNTILILDVLSNFESDVKSPEKASKFMRLLRKLNNKGVNIILLHHNNKHENENGKKEFQGTTVWMDRADQVYQLTRVSEHGEQIATLTFEAKKDKNAYLNGASGIVFKLDKSKPLNQCLELGVYIPDETQYDLSENQRAIYDDLKKIFSSEKADIAFTQAEICKRMGINRKLEPSKVQAVRRTIIKLANDGILSSTKIGNKTLVSWKRAI